MLGLAAKYFYLILKLAILLLALGMMFNSARVLGKPEGNYDAEAKLSARVVFIICLVIAFWAAASLYRMLGKLGG